MLWTPFRIDKQSMWHIGWQSVQNDDCKVVTLFAQTQYVHVQSTLGIFFRCVRCSPVWLFHSVCNAASDIDSYTIVFHSTWSNRLTRVSQPKNNNLISFRFDVLPRSLHAKYVCCHASLITCAQFQTNLNEMQQKFELTMRWLCRRDRFFFNSEFCIHAYEICSPVNFN